MRPIGVLKKATIGSVWVAIDDWGPSPLTVKEIRHRPTAKTKVLILFEESPNAYPPLVLWQHYRPEQVVI
jgi:hypothetical protein